MVIKQIYECEFCNKQFHNEKRCFNHELGHLHINRDIYDHWMELIEGVRFCRQMIRECNDEFSKMRYEMALEKLEKFEKKYKLTGIRYDGIKIVKGIGD